MRIPKSTPASVSTPLARAACAVATLLFSGISPAWADPGDTLDSFDAHAVGVPLCGSGSGIGTGLAYDGTNLILSCWGSNVLERVTPTGTYNDPVTINGVSVADGLGALSWDPGRQKLWACDLDSGGQKVVLIDMATKAVVASPDSPAPFAVADCTYGLAYDPSDDSLWVSNPFDSMVYKYMTDGSLSSQFRLEPMDGYPNAGIAVACGELYYSTFNGSAIFRGPKGTSADPALFYQQGSAWLSGMAVDGNTFKPSPGWDALWVVDADNTQPPGTRNLYAVELPAGCVSSAPVCTAATASPATLWPPNREFAPITITGVTGSDGNPVVITPTSIRQDEIVNGDGRGSGSTAPDAMLSPLAVRAERNGSPSAPGDGRVYHIGFTANDGNGGTCTGSVTVCVPHDQRPGAACVDSGPLHDSLLP